MDHKAIETMADYDLATDEIESLCNANVQKDTPDFQRLELLTDLVQQFDDKQLACFRSTPAELIDAFMDLTGRTQKDLAELIGSTTSQASEILAGNLSLTKELVRLLCEEWNMPIDLPHGEEPIAPSDQAKS